MIGSTKSELICLYLSEFCTKLQYLLVEAILMSKSSSVVALYLNSEAQMSIQPVTLVFLHLQIWDFAPSKVNARSSKVTIDQFRSEPVKTDSTFISDQSILR